MPEITKRREQTAPVKYGAVSYWLTVLCVVLLTVVCITAGVLAMMIRADANVALGNAKTVRIALQTTAAEAYGTGTPFSDPSHEGGVTEEVYQEVMLLSKAPGEFWVLQTAKEGYGVQRFVYTEGPFTVTYTAEPASWTVTGAYDLIHAVP